MKEEIKRLKAEVNQLKSNLEGAKRIIKQLETANQCKEEAIEEMAEELSKKEQVIEWKTKASENTIGRDITFIIKL